MLRDRIRVHRVAVGVLLCGALPALLWSAPPEGKGGGKDNGGSTPPAPVRFQVVWSGLPLGAEEAYLTDINNAGVAAGCVWDSTLGWRAILWTPQGIEDINAMAGDDLPSGWIAQQVVDINSQGRVVGEAFHSDYGYQAFVYDPSLTPSFQLVPQSAGYGYYINDDGDLTFGTGWMPGERTIAHCYTYAFDPTDPSGYENPLRVSELPVFDGAVRGINNAGQIVGYYLDADGNYGGVFRYTPAGSPGIEIWDIATTAFVQAYDINNSGWFVGYYGGPYGAQSVFRFDDGATNTETGFTDVGDGFGRLSLNNRGDIVSQVRGTPYAQLFTDDPLKTSDPVAYNLDALVDPTDAKWFSSGKTDVDVRDINDPNSITDPEETEFGQICGFSRFFEGKGKNERTWIEAFILLPVKP